MNLQALRNGRIDFRGTQETNRCTGIVLPESRLQDLCNERVRFLFGVTLTHRSENEKPSTD